MSEKQRCRWCQKMVRDKPVLGTLHFCLSPEERNAAEYNYQMGRWQMDVQKRVAKDGPYIGLTNLSR